MPIPATSSGSQTPVDLAAMNTEQRQNMYKRWFSKVAELKTINRPRQCEDYPAFSKEISEAYMRHTTFTVKIWTNYDAAANEFYSKGPGNESNRYDTCGKLVLTPDAERHVYAVVPRIGEFARVRFQVGTPFRTMCEVGITIEGSRRDVGLDVTVCCKDMTRGEHPFLMDYIRGVCDRTMPGYPCYGGDGLVLRDLMEIALLFRGQMAEDSLDQDSGRREEVDRGRRGESDCGRREKSNRGRDGEVTYGLLDYLNASLGGMGSHLDDP